MKLVSCLPISHTTFAHWHTDDTEVGIVAAKGRVLFDKRRRFTCYTAAKRAGRFVPPFLRNVTAAAAKARFEDVRTQELGQVNNYFGAIADIEIPYWRLMYICNTTRTASYFLK